ncbi:signal peptidase II [Myceligenerans crystallogenes]|uniref:Lipoprotein signal peptidase n=1 Tax=Myceligenerans crystallogenes TaxID=316335 RepID=A0ABN2NKN5_9MICO
MSTRAQNENVTGEGRPGPARASGGNRALLVLTGTLAVAVLVVDQLTKWWAESALSPGGEPVQLVGELLQLRLVYNPGAALSIATGMTWVLTIIVVVVVIAILRLMRRIGSRGWAVSLGLLLGGAVGNLVDRLARDPGFARGHVVDFIDYAGLFVGNVADIAIVVAAVWIAVLSVRGIGVDGRREGEQAPASSDGGGAEPGGPGEARHADGSAA